MSLLLHRITPPQYLPNNDTSKRYYPTIVWYIPRPIMLKSKGYVLDMKTSTKVVWYFLK